MSLARRGKRETGRAKAVMQVAMEGFFQKAAGKSKAEVLKIYKEHEKMWLKYAYHINTSNLKRKKAFLHVDGFESAIHSAHHKILKSKAPDKTKLTMLRSLRPFHNKLFFVYQLPIWTRLIFKRLWGKNST
jgi:hypothetical protein